MARWRDPGVRERAVDPHVAHREVAARRPRPGLLLLGVRRVGDARAQLVERQHPLAADEVVLVGGQRGLHGAQPVEHRDPARRGQARPSGEAPRRDRRLRRKPASLAVRRGRQAKPLGATAACAGSRRAWRCEGWVGPVANSSGRRQPRDVQLGVVRREDVGDEGVERVQPQGGAPQVRGVEDPAADGGDRQRLAGGDLVVAEPGDRLQQRRLPDPGLPADPDVHRVAGEPGLQHPQQPDRLGGAFPRLGERQRQRLAQLGRRRGVRAQRIDGGGERRELFVDRAPALHLGRTPGSRRRRSARMRAIRASVSTRAGRGRAWRRCPTGAVALWCSPLRW